MPREGHSIFRDLVGKLEILSIKCDKCGRRGRYRLDRLIERCGIDAKLFDWSDENTADCPRKHAQAPQRHLRRAVSPTYRRWCEEISSYGIGLTHPAVAAVHPSHSLRSRPFIVSGLVAALLLDPAVDCAENLLELNQQRALRLAQVMDLARPNPLQQVLHKAPTLLH
jgi:hypothetical protein